ncbi:Uncharacterized protein FKW44_007495 [Caligus rogercresseyi]|uniref:Uncharacterized protein n=1 Tax=Caligus rogercresseyi TaxID=217165 RepID=A0A7T8KEU4_CALRO|nr:Uncharacterized protein FKW44_007495 [Caligus rogercresseyi]
MELPPHIKVGPELLLKEFWQFLASKLLATLKPDLNPLDFAVWGFLERETNSNPHPNVDSLKASTTAAWANISTDFIKKSCAAFRHC